MLDGARPELVEFLKNMRRNGNAYWENHVPETLHDFRTRGVGGTTWASGTRWMARLREDEISALETANNITFPADMRAFLAILGGTDRPALRFSYEGADLQRVSDRHVFANWWGDPELLVRTAEWVLEGILFDVERNEVWVDTWGPRPATAQARRTIVAQQMAAAPKLLPLHGHRFLVAGLDLEPAPVLSGVQTDFILYANSIEHCLAKDFPSLCANTAPAPRPDTEGTAAFNHLKTVPFWGDFLT